MFGKLLILFTVVPVVELYILVKVGKEIGTMNTVGLVIITGIAGASFAKSQGAQIIYKIRTALNQGQMPGTELMHGAMVLAGGIMLLTPGFLTDLVGLSMLIPFTRKFYADMTMNYFKKKFQSGQWQYSTYSTTDTETKDPNEVIIDQPEIEDKESS
jgi:UPF0716 protein FxsA